MRRVQKQVLGGSRFSTDEIVVGEIRDTCMRRLDRGERIWTADGRASRARVEDMWTQASLDNTAVDSVVDTDNKLRFLPHGQAAATNRDSQPNPAVQTLKFSFKELHSISAQLILSFQSHKTHHVMSR